MCGICGIAIFDQRQVPNRDLLLTMMNSIRHRGPDDQGYYIDKHVGLGSQRLSIIDLELGRQPIANENDTIYVVFNGEIYNYKELREYLERRGHQFSTKTDTEVLLHIYEEYGYECLQYLDGIFAFAIWDKHQKTLFLGRDRMGIKPMYYSQVNSQLIFGSEMKTILAHPDVKRDIDLISLNEYLSYEYVPTPRTIIRNVFRLEAGSYLIFNERGLAIKRYWDISFQRSESHPPVDWRDYASGLYETLGSCVRKELVSDVPVGVLLSGGIDSSTIAAFMTDYYPGRVESFSIGFAEGSFDESQYARQVANHLGTQHNELILTSKMAVDIIANIAEILDEPFADSSFIPTYLLARFASEKVKVVLGGDGGDELLAGYPTIMAHRMIDLYERLVPWSIRARIMPRLLERMSVSFDNISLDFRLRRFLSGRGVPLVARHHRWLGSFIDEEKDALLQVWIKPVLRDTYHQAYVSAAASDARKPMNQILYDDLKLYLEGDILYKVDRASMASSLEVRVPFLNNASVQFISELPFELKLRGVTSKFILKKAIKHRLPAEIINRPKKGFNMPVAYWLNTDLQEMLVDLLSPDRIHQQGLFNSGFIRKLLDDHANQHRDHRKLLWTLLIFQIWYQKYVE
jgi:asparagine synthase (glutamine-hydrolysing)